jgi:hypothetical protein
MSLTFISAPIDYKTLYNVEDPLATRPFRLTTITHSDWMTYELSVGLANGTWCPEQPVILGVNAGGQVTDFLWSDSVRLVCVSSRVIALLADNGITGWSTYPVELYDRQKKPIPGYRGLAVLGSIYRRDRSRSQIIAKPPPVLGGLGHDVYKGLYFDESQWDGADMFRVSNAGIVVTGKVYRLFKRARISNVRFTPLTEVEIDVYLDRFDPSMTEPETPK